MIPDPIQLKIPIVYPSQKMPNRLPLSPYIDSVHNVAMNSYKIGQFFLISELRTQCEEHGIFPENDQNGFMIATSKLEEIGFMRIGEAGVRMKRKSCGGRPDILWKRVK